MTDNKMPKAIILAGGFGTRISEEMFKLQQYEY